MSWRDYLYRAWSYLFHQVWSWNTGGEGIHSPYLFYLVRMLLYDQNSYYSWSDIETCRRQMLADTRSIHVEDYGTGRATPAQRSIASIARNSLESAKIGQLLFRWIAYLGHVQQRPLHCVELGTSLGITTAYMALPSSHNTIQSYEGSSSIAQIARANWKQLKIQNIESVEGNIDNTFISRAHDAQPPIDILYIDANHTREATLRYFQEGLKRRTEHSIFFVDDIYYSRQMQQAWKEICQMPEVSCTMNLYHVGIVFFDPHFLRKHYRLRI